MSSHPVQDAHGNTYPKRRSCGGCLGTVLFGLNVFLRLTFTAVTLVVLVLALALVWPESSPRVKKGSALVLSPYGLIVEELSGNPLDRVIGSWLGQSLAETPFRDLIVAIDQAATDDDIAALYLDLDSLLGAGPSKLVELGEVIDAFRETGKRVVASADFYTRSRYQLAAHADEIYLHEMGAVLLDGYSVYRTYIHDGLERLGVDWNVFRVGTYKSAVETYERDDMSPAAEASNRAWLDDLWDAYLEDVSEARGIERSALESFATDVVEGLRAAGGDSARQALDAGLVDHVTAHDAVRDRMIELVGTGDDHSFKQIGHAAYLEARGRDDDRSGDAVGVIVARGTIVPGNAPAGAIGGDSTARLVRQARFDDEIKAVVLRVDSGGGSAFASEIVRREIELLSDAGKPVVVSMSSVAASGGYWIAMAADEVWAHPVTLTGSIGIFAYFPTFEDPLARFLGLRVDGIGTTPLAGRLRPDLPLPEAAGEAIQLSVEHGYRQFVDLVAASRGMEPEAIEAVAGGRVWSGMDAAELGLVDHLGGYADAIRSAAALAGLGDDPPVRLIERQPSLRERLLAGLLVRAERLPGLGRAVSERLPKAVRFEWQLRRVLDAHGDLLAAARDPRGLVAHCLCGVE